MMSRRTGQEDRIEEAGGEREGAGVEGGIVYALLAQRLSSEGQTPPYVL